MEGFTKEPRLVVLSSEPSAVSDRALAKFAGFLGVTAQLAPVHAGLAGPPPEVLTEPERERCLALSLATFGMLKSQAWFPGLLPQAKAILVYGVGVTGTDCGELKELTQGALASVVAVEAKKVEYHIHGGGKHRAFPISGRSYTVEPPTVPLAFGSASAQDGVDTLISVNGQPCFVSVPRGRGTLYLLSSATLVDIDDPFPPNCQARQWYAELLSLSIFLRSVFGRWCWTAPVRAATIVIDDPYLKKRYGFLRYKTLVRELQQTGCSLTVGFIPYNYWRSDRRVTNMLRGQRDRFSITVHGCDHTRGEFASLDEMLLKQRARLALERMDIHTKLTQMPYDRVMMFPHERFSTKAIRALKECGYLAAANMSPWPVDSAESPVTLRDVFDVAVTRYDSFAIFGRRYPYDNGFELAVDAFFQKPLLVAEHHTFFKSGFEPLRQVMRELATLDTPPVWMPLHEALTSTFVVKRAGPGHYAARFFTPLLRLRNTDGEPCLYSLTKPEEPGLVEAVMVDGESVPFEWQSGFLKCDVHLGTGEERDVKVLYRAAAQRNNHHRRSWNFRSRVFARRMLSDMRDNYLSKSDRLLAAAEKAKDRLFKDDNG